MPGSTTVLGLTTLVGSDTVDIVTHISTGIAQRVENLFTGAAAPAGNLTIDFNSASNRTLTLANVGAGTAGLVVDDSITATAGPLSVGSVPATTGGMRLGNNNLIGWRNATNSANFTFGFNASNQYEFGNADVKYGLALVAMGGGAAPTLGTIGGSGPTVAGQNTWKREIDSTGATYWIPVWK